MQASNLRKGNVIIFNGEPHRVMEVTHNTPGNLRANVKLKLRNLLKGSQTETKLGATQDVEEADVFYFRATFLYSDADGYHFMNTDNYEQFSVGEDVIGEGNYYLQDQMEVEITTYNGTPIGIKFPSTVVLTVVETEPEVRGGTATNSYKPAITDSGLKLSVPPFIKEGEKIVVSTETGEYKERL